LVDENEVRALLFGAGFDFRSLAGSYKILRVGARSRGEHQANAHGPRRRRQRLKLSRVVRIDGMPDADADQYSALTALGAFKQLQSAYPSPDHPSFDNGRFRDFAVLTGGQAHVARRHDGGNGMFIDHLTDAVSQQDDELIERIDMSLQLDAVHQIDRDWDALFAQGVQKWVLQRLATGHGRAPCCLCR
jgi:hypothetical protein